MMTLEGITAFAVPEDIADVTDDQLRAAGNEGVERFVLWSGTVDGTTFRVQTAHVPKQSAYKTDRGLFVRIDGDELHRLNVWLYTNREQLGIQVHSHPTDAFHSELDDSFAMVTILGGLSIVVPDFALGGIRGDGVAVYRLMNEGWVDVSAAAQLVVFED